MDNMAIPYLHASSYQRRMTSGRTRPCLFFCEDADGEIIGEYVVKLRAGVVNTEVGLFSELMASQLAGFLNIPTPEPAIIIVNPELADIIKDPQLESDIRSSSGHNFGSKVITGGLFTWPIGEAIPQSLKQVASEVFAFDAMIQMPKITNHLIGISNHVNEFIDEVRRILQ
ncbi:MAG: hypothetical protein HY807_05320 [Nitrospirae bacterium]|nr:hypothetical protein [Nitrospirota bacterium]